MFLYAAIRFSEVRKKLYVIPKWVSPIRLMRYNVPLDCIAETLQISHQSAWEWQHRVFITVGWLSGPHRP